MKLLHKVLITILGIVVVLDGLLFFTGKITQDFFKETFQYVAIENLDLSGPLNEMLEPLGLPSFVEDVIKEAIDDVKNQVAQSDAFQEYTTKYSEQLLTNVADKKAAIPSINQDLKTLIQNEVKDFGGIFNGIMEQSDVQSFFNNLVDITNPEALYQTFVNTTRDQFTTPQYMLIQMVHYISQENLVFICLAIFVVCIICMMALYRNLYKWLLPTGISCFISGGLLLLLHFMLPYLLSLTSVSDNIVTKGLLECAGVWDMKIGIVYGIAGILLILIFLISNRILSSQKELKTI